MQSELKRPRNYLPVPRNPLFQPRAGEFERLEHLLFQQVTALPLRIGLVGVIGMGGVGKTQLATQLAYRYEQRFPSGVFWLTATGTEFYNWQLRFAELAFNTDYLLPDDDISSPENDARRARHFCHYLTQHADALLILDNVEDPDMVVSALPALAGREAACTVLYTSRKQSSPGGVTLHTVERLPKEAAWRLLLTDTRPHLLQEILAGSQHPEAWSARKICDMVGYFPLALNHLRGLLRRDPHITLGRLLEILQERGALELARQAQDDAAPLFATFWLSWEKVEDERARQVFKLASSFPEAMSIPLWLLGLAADLGERDEITEPLGEACQLLQELSLLERLSNHQARLHPLLREFGQRVVADDTDEGQALLEEARKRLDNGFTNLDRLELRALREGYWRCLEQVRAAREYAVLLGSKPAQRIERIERWLDRESHLFVNADIWPEKLPGLFYQQMFNSSVEDECPLLSEAEPVRWVRQTKPAEAEDKSLLRIFTGHSDAVNSVAFSPDTSKVLTGSADGTARLYEAQSGRVLAVLEIPGELVHSTRAIFSPDGRQVLTYAFDKVAHLWETATGRLLALLEGHADTIQEAVFSPDGKKIATCSTDTTIRLWDAASGKALATLESRSPGLYLRFCS